MTLLFDFDGTIVDISDKYYAVYTAFVIREGGVSLSQRRYWEMMRAASSHGEILKASCLDSVMPETFRAFIQNDIELEEFLRNDSLFEGAGEVLKEVSKEHRCYLVSMRRNASLFRQQVEWLGIRKYFKDIITPTIFAEDIDVSVAAPKGEVLKGIKITLPAIIVGDSGMDIRTGQQLGITTCAVTTGIRDRSVLERYSPDFIIDALDGIPDVIKRVGRR